MLEEIRRYLKTAEQAICQDRPFEAYHVIRTALETVETVGLKREEAQKGEDQ